MTSNLTYTMKLIEQLNSEKWNDDEKTKKAQTRKKEALLSVVWHSGVTLDDPFHHNSSQQLCIQTVGL